MGRNTTEDGEDGGCGGIVGRDAAAKVDERTASACPRLKENALPPFLTKTYGIVDDPATDAIVSWGTGNNSFVVWNEPTFARDLLPKYFSHNNFSSFVRQLNCYGFKKVNPDCWEFANEGFLRGQKHLLRSINRRRPSHANAHSQPEKNSSQNASVSTCMEVGNVGLEEIVQNLNKDKNVLMQELVTLRQQQQATDSQLQTLVKRLQGMEQWQQQMMSFLTMAIQSAGFFSQFVQTNDRDSPMLAANKKRRHAKQESIAEREIIEMVKYRTLINESAKTMLRQILKMNTSPRTESMCSSDSLMGTFQSLSEALEISSGENSGAMLPKAPSESTIMSASPCSAACSSSAEFNQSSVVTRKIIGTGKVRDTGMPYAYQKDIAPTPTDIRNLVLCKLLATVCEDGGVDMPIENSPVPQSDKLYVNPQVSTLEEAVTIGADVFSGDMDANFHLYEEKLCGIIDSFWGQLLMATPTCDIEDPESSSSIQEAEGKEQIRDNVWNDTEHMIDLTEEMEYL
ncbi:heat stress transcription factor A-1-like [Canna indica]|uniref:Heat stress transcription factor A-1-like n=1 Tax=Canna indica TaxID=4628 RepID=A0AAQ3Q6U1_9LILI|nr:heat stress transcription factor A-1-like [Canna indica]